MSDDIKPRIVDGVGYCDEECSQAIEDEDEHHCAVEGFCMYLGPGSCPILCPVHVRRVAAERDRLREWAREANALLCKQFEMGSSLFPYAKVASLIRTYPIDEEVTP